MHHIKSEETEAKSSGQVTPTIWRMHLKPGAANGFEEVFIKCLAGNYIGLGWSLWHPVATLEEYFVEYPKQYSQLNTNSKERKRWLSTLGTFARQIMVGDLVWVRFKNNYFICRICSEWQQRIDDDAKKHDLGNVRQVEFAKVGSDAPGKVLACFRSPRTLQRIDNPTVNEVSRRLFNECTQRAVYSLSPACTNVFDLLDDRDTEDLVALFLQIKYNYALSPKSRSRDTQEFEFELVERQTGERAHVQVKTGNIKLNPLVYATQADKVYLFSPAGYTQNGTARVVCLEPDDLAAFLRTEGKFLTDSLNHRIADWCRSADEPTKD